MLFTFDKAVNFAKTLTKEKIEEHLKSEELKYQKKRNELHNSSNK